MKKKKTAVKKVKINKTVKVIKKVKVVKKAKPSKQEKAVPKKKVKKESAPIAASANQDIIGLLTMLVQKLTLFESKLDMVLSRLATPAVSVAPAHKPAVTVVAPSSAMVQNKPLRPVRQMYEVVCADCKQDCSVPFKPRADSPVYCKGCFSQRKAKGPVKPEVSKPKEELQPVVKSQKAKSLKPISKNKPQTNTNKAKKK